MSYDIEAEVLLLLALTEEESQDARKKIKSFSRYNYGIQETSKGTTNIKSIKRRGSYLLNSEDLEMDTSVEDEVISVEHRAATDKQPVETIDLDDDQFSIPNADPDIIVVESHTNLFDWISKENKTLTDIIEKCLDLEYSEGMLNILEGVLVRAYKKLDETYKKSSEFERVLTKSLRAIENDPKHKFVHVKNLYETFQAHSMKKRVPLVSCRPDKNLKRKITNNSKQRDTSKHKKSDEIIDLEDEPPCDKNNEPKSDNLDVIVIQESRKPLSTDKGVIEGNTDEKENKDQNTSVPVNEESILMQMLLNSKEKRTDNTLLSPVIEDKNVNQDHNALLTPLTEEFVNCRDDHYHYYEVPVTFEEQTHPNSSDVDAKEKRIQELRYQICAWKRSIAKLEQEEVDFTSWSSYMKVDNYKATVVNLYKELCKLTGNKPFKKQTIRLKVLDGHPAPVRVLEEYLNNNMSNTGELHFPDLSEVVKCVETANIDNQLCWSKQKIMTEAYILFKECGRTLQKRRMKREWRDMMDTVKCESFEDPADTDLALRARLEENRRLGDKKEKSIIDRYASKAAVMAKRNSNVGNTVRIQQITAAVNAANKSINDSGAASDLSLQNSSSCDSTNEIDDIDTKTFLLNSLRDKSNEIITRIEPESLKIDPCKLEPDVIIKTEPEYDFVLPELGENYTFTLSVEDPYMVVEISSDEEDEVV